jgi:hypothetical protein
MEYARDDETADKRRIETDFEDKFEKMQEEEDRQRKVMSAENGCLMGRAEEGESQRKVDIGVLS